MPTACTGADTMSHKPYAVSLLPVAPDARCRLGLVMDLVTQWLYASETPQSFFQAALEPPPGRLRRVQERLCRFLVAAPGVPTRQVAAGRQV